MPSARKQTSQLAGLVYPVGRLHRLLRHKHIGPVTKTAAVYMAGVLEYLTREAVDASAEAAASEQRTCISNRSIFVGFQHDNELRRLYESVGMMIPGGGSLQTCLAPKKQKLLEALANLPQQQS